MQIKQMYIKHALIKLIKACSPSIMLAKITLNWLIFCNKRKELKHINLKAKKKVVQLLSVYPCTHNCILNNSQTIL